MADEERLVVLLEARVNDFERRMASASASAMKNFKQIERSATTMRDRVSASAAGAAGRIGQSFARTGAAIAAGFATGRIAKSFVDLSESATRIDNALKVAGLSGAELEVVYSRLNKAAIANGAPIESLVTLYSKAAQAQAELGATSQELIDFSGNVALALRVAGTDATAASGSLLQLGQALGSGTVHAEEFNSILEGVPTIAQAVAAGLKEAGGSVSKLKSLVVDGKVSSEAFFRAFEAGAPLLEQKVAGSVSTVAQATNNLWTALTDAAREFNHTTGASERFADGINGAAQAINSFDISGFLNKVQEARKAYEDWAASVGNSDIAKKLAESVGAMDGDGKFINLDASQAEEETSALEKEVKLLQERIELNTRLGFDNSEALARLGEVQAALAQIQASAADMPATISGYQVGPNGIEAIPSPEDSTNVGGKGPATRGSRRPKTVTPVSLTSFPVSSSGSGGGRKRGGGGGGGESDYQREIEQIKERTAAIQAEAAAQSTVNPLIDDYGFASERARAASDLLTAAQKSGLAVGKELSDVTQLLSGNFDGLSPAAQAQSMLDLANGYASASAEAEQLAHSQDLVRQSADDFKSLAKDAVGGFISDLRNGKSATEALANALDKVTEKLLDMALNSAFDGLFSGGGIGSLFSGGGSQFASAAAGKLLPGLFSEGGYTGAGGKYEPAGIVHRGEYVMDAETVKRLGVGTLQRLQGYANGGLVGAPSMPKLTGRSSGGSGGSPVFVNITNKTSAQIKQESRETAGGTQIDVLIDDLVADKMQTPGSRSRGAVASQFGLKSGLARR
jgi:tape measure domain-containing protein